MTTKMATKMDVLMMINNSTTEKEYSSLLFLFAGIYAAWVVKGEHYMNYSWEGFQARESLDNICHNNLLISNHFEVRMSS